MQVGRHFLRLDGYARSIVFEAVAALMSTRLGLRVAGFRRWQAVLAWLAPIAPNSGDLNCLSGAREISRLEAATARHLFFQTTCLENSLALWWLLRRHGIAAELRMGARKEASRFEAHAWVELDGAILTEAAAEDVHFVPFERHVSSLEAQAR